MTAANPNNTTDLTDMPDNWRADLFRVLDRQREICACLSTLAQKQTKLLGAAHSHDLLSVLAERQTFIDELHDLGRKLDPYRNAWADLPTALGEVEYRRLVKLTDGVLHAVGEIRKVDLRDQEKLRRERDRIRSKIDTVDTGRSSNRAYSRAIQPAGLPRTNRFMDHRG